jgi:hypothetical protein
MRCRDVARLSSAYVDGQLDDGRSSALRGHLRQCDRCRELVEDQVRLLEVAEELEPLDPPPAMWAAIGERLAAAEVGDAHRSRLWLWWQGARAYGLPAAVAVVAVIAAGTFWMRDGAPEAEVATGRAQQGVAAGDARVVDPAPAIEFEVARTAEIERADRRYVEAIDDLRQLAERERERWSTDQVAAFDTRVAEFERAVRDQRQGSRDVRTGIVAGGAPGRDPLYAVYQQQIDYLQRAVLDGEVMP